MDIIAKIFEQIFPVAAVGAGLALLLRGWISERLKQSISHEYSEKLETFKNELNLRVQALRHEYEVNRLRTSLFFDHQRMAFAEILAKIAEVNCEWLRTGYEDEVGFIEPVSKIMLQQLRQLCYKHQLFLDNDSIMAMELLFEIYQDSFNNSKIPESYDSAEYLRPRIAALFQQKIGVASDKHPIKQIALLGAIRILNRYHFHEIDLPVSGQLKLGWQDAAADGVMKAEHNFGELVRIMRKFQTYLQTKTTTFYEAEASLERYLTVLDPKLPSNDA